MLVKELEEGETHLRDVEIESEGESCVQRLRQHVHPKQDRILSALPDSCELVLQANERNPSLEALKARLNGGTPVISMVFTFLKCKRGEDDHPK